MRCAAGFAHGRDLIVERMPVVLQNVFAGDDDIDLIGALIDRPANFLQPQVKRHQPGRETRGDGGHRNARAVKRAHRMGHLCGIDTDRAGGQAHITKPQPRDDMRGQRVARLGAKPRDPACRVIACKCRQIDQLHRVYQPCRLMLFFQRPACAQRCRAPFGGGTVDGVAFEHRRVKRDPGIAGMAVHRGDLGGMGLGVCGGLALVAHGLHPS